MSILSDWVTECTGSCSCSPRQLPGGCVDTRLGKSSIVVERSRQDELHACKSGFALVCPLRCVGAECSTHNHVAVHQVRPR